MSRQSEHTEAVGLELLAYLRGVTPGAAHKAKVSGTIEVDPETGLCPLRSEKNRRWIHRRPQPGRKADENGSISPAAEAGAYPVLEAEKLKADIDYKRRQSRKLDRDHAVAMGKLFPEEVVLESLSAFGSGVRTFLLQIPPRIAPQLLARVQAGAQEEEIRDALEGEIGDGVERAVSMGERAAERAATERSSQADQESGHDSDS